MFLLCKIVKIRVYFLRSPIVNFNLSFWFHLINLSSNLLSFCNHFFSTLVKWLNLFIFFLQRNYSLNSWVLRNKNLHFLNFLLVSWWLSLSLCRFWRLIFVTSTSAFIKFSNQLWNFKLKRILLMLWLFLFDLFHKPRICAHKRWWNKGCFCFNRYLCFWRNASFTWNFADQAKRKIFWRLFSSIANFWKIRFSCFGNFNFLFKLFWFVIFALLYFYLFKAWFWRTFLKNYVILCEQLFDFAWRTLFPWQ